MNEESSPDPQDPKTPGAAFLWLLLAFVPGVLALALPNSSLGAIGPLLFFFGAGCCLASGFGIADRMKNPAARILVGLLLSGAFFVLNVIIVILIGCSSMGRIAP
jgi:hypothetical protein